MRWTLNNDTFDTMYNDLRTYVLSSSDDVPVLTTAPTTAATTLPTQQPLAIANAAIDHHDLTHVPSLHLKHPTSRQSFSKETQVQTMQTSMKYML
jgi:hypothetical protein